MNKLVRKIVLTGVLACGFAASALAAPVTLHVTWSGATYGNDSFGSGTVSFDDSQLAFDGVLTESPFFGHIDLLFSNGIDAPVRYDESRYYGVNFWKLPELDLSRELIGQTLANGCQYGVYAIDCDREFGDLNLLSNDGAPTNVDYFRMGSPHFGNMAVTSIKVERVPEPGSLALFVLAAGALAAARRRKA